MLNEYLIIRYGCARQIQYAGTLPSIKPKNYMYMYTVKIMHAQHHLRAYSPTGLWGSFARSNENEMKLAYQVLFVSVNKNEELYLCSPFSHDNNSSVSFTPQSPEIWTWVLFGSLISVLY